MNAASWLILAGFLTAFVAAIVHRVRAHKRGNSCGCGGCDGCSGCESLTVPEGEQNN